MKRTLTILICLLFGTISVSGMSQFCHRTTTGTDFWFGFMDNAIINLKFADCVPNKLVPLHYGQIIVTSEVGADFQITVGSSNTPLGGTYHVNAGSMDTVKFDVDANPRNAIHLTSDQPVSVYTLNFSEYTSDIALIYPSNSLGKEYFAMCGQPDPIDNIMFWINYSGSWEYGGWGRQSTSEFLIVATQDRTIVDIIPTKKVNNSDAPFRITLNRGEQYLVTAVDSTVGAGGLDLDLTGSYIKSNNPVALFSGCTWTQNPSGPSGTPGHMYEQIPSLQTWGKKFIAVPFKKKKRDTWRVLASYPGTTVRVTGKPPVNLNKGGWTEFNLSQGEPSLIESNNPVLVAQFTSGGSESCDTCANESSMVIVSPVNQASERTAFVTCDYVPFSNTQWCPCRGVLKEVGYIHEKLDISTCEYYINVIAKDDAAGKINLDNKQINFNSLPGSGYGYAQIKISPGSHLLESTEPGKGFVAYAYNYWDKEVRSYGLAQTQDLFVDLATYNNTGPEIPDVWCYGDTLKAGEDYDTYKWNNNLVTASWIIPQISGRYLVNVRTNDGCNLTDSIELKIDKPVVDLGKDRLVCLPDSTVLDAGSQSAGIPFIHWQWSPVPDTVQKITVRNAGTYGIQIIDRYGCKGSDEIKVSTDKRPVINFSKLDTLVCGSKIDTLSVTVDKGSFTVKRLSDSFIFNGLNVGVPDYGTYPFLIRATDNLSCYSESAVRIGFHETPKVNLGRDTIACTPDTIVLDAGDNLSKYSWLTGQTSRKIAVTQSGTYGVNVMNSHSCWGSGKVALSFLSRPQLNLKNTDTLFCGTKSAVLNVSTDKGSFSVERLSDHFIFNGLNVNVPVYDSYKFRVIATDPNKCSSDAVINVGFHKIPAVSINIDSTKCYGYNLGARYIGDADINRSDFTWVFGRDTINHAIGANSLVIPLGFNQTVRDLKLTVSDLGCLNSKTISNIKVVPLAQVWAADSVGCAPFTALFKTSSSEPVTYDWNFGDGTRLSGLTANPSHTYRNIGYYPVTLKVTTGQGCINETRADSMIYVAAFPSVGFSLNPGECLNSGDNQISFTGDGSQVAAYLWDLSALDAGDIIHNPGTSPGPLVFNLTNKSLVSIGLEVISKYGCKSDSQIIIKRKPLYSLSVNNEKGCAPLETHFEAIPGDNTDNLTYSWDFGDGTTGTGLNAMHTYTGYDKIYDVGLTALSALTGCRDKIIRSDLVKSYKKPVAAFSLDKNTVAVNGAALRFINESTGAVSYLWDFGDGSTSEEVDATHQFPKFGHRIVVLKAFNEFSCTDTISHDFMVAFEKIFTPNAFSPNAHNEIDREFLLNTDGVKPEGYHFMIISRWNDLVFEVKNEIKGWEGRLSNGNMAPAGNYLWVLDYYDTSGRPHHQTGTVTLIY